MQTILRVFGLLIVASLLWTPSTSAAPIKHRATMQYMGTASWYGQDRQGRKMANGQRFDCHKLTAASWYFPFGTELRVLNIKNGESVVVTITDRGPNLRLHRILDLSSAAADQLDYLGEGLTAVFVYPVIFFNLESTTFNIQLEETP